MYELDCPKTCCKARYCPLVLSWATTVHKFQGFEAGFDENDDIRYIIADIASLQWEKTHPGTAYVVASRAKTIGKVNSDKKYPKDSNLFFTGPIGTQRFTRCLYKENGEKCSSVQKRDLWVQHLKEKELNTRSRRTDDSIKAAKIFVNKKMNHEKITTRQELNSRIVEMVRNPNEVWKSLRENYEL